VDLSVTADGGALGFLSEERNGREGEECDGGERGSHMSPDVGIN
jgi:hypothetical protein